MTKSTLHKLVEYGQSPWLDNITRGLITSGELKALIDKGIVGVTANPTIFEKALASGSDYDDAISELFRQNKSARDIYHSLLSADVSAAADIFRPVFDATNGLDGYISIEVTTPTPLLRRRWSSGSRSTVPTSSSRFQPPQKASRQSKNFYTRASTSTSP